MFASQIIENYNAQIAAVTTEIAEVEKYLADLRAREAALETEKQAALTLEAAGQSALDQTRQFLALARAHDKMIAAFWEKMDEIRNEQLSVGDLPFSDNTEEKVDYFPEDTVTVEVEPTDSDTEPVSDGHEEEIEANANGNGHHLTEADLKSYTLAQLKKIALKHGVKTKQGKDSLAQDLSTLHLSQEDIDKVLT